MRRATFCGLILLLVAASGSAGAFRDHREEKRAQVAFEKEQQRVGHRLAPGETLGAQEWLSVSKQMTPLDSVYKFAFPVLLNGAPTGKYAMKGRVFQLVDIKQEHIASTKLDVGALARGIDGIMLRGTTKQTIELDRVKHLRLVGQAYDDGTVFALRLRKQASKPTFNATIDAYDFKGRSGHSRHFPVALSGSWATR